MKFFRCYFALILAGLLLLESAPAVRGCGPSVIEPIFVFKESPDLPFNEFVNGNLGIVQPGFGRKTLVIAYRYLNGNAFDAGEQADLIEALKGKAPEDDGTAAVKIWLSVRKELLGVREELPEIYTERQYGGYDFFPNCTRNAFEVATETLKSRVGSFGATDPNVRAWLLAQDMVFQNCGGGTALPEELGAESPEWLRHDREYQMGAALLYSLKFDDARARFEKIAADNSSPWQQTAAYLVARTLVRQASFAKSDTARHELYAQTELYLQTLLAQGGNFYNAAQGLLGLVKYRSRPADRVRELAMILATETGNENLRQDLIDYVWLLDKFESQVWREEAERKEAQQVRQSREDSAAFGFNKQRREESERIKRGERIEVTLEQRKSDGSPDYSHWIHQDFKYDASDDEIEQAFELELGRKLTPEEVAQLKAARLSALQQRHWSLSPNQNWTAERYEGWSRGGEELPAALMPPVLRADELGDWIFTFKSADPAAYAHARSKWRATESNAWLVAALTKAQTASPGLERLLRAAERVGRDDPAFATVSFQLVRLQVAQGRKVEARKLLDDIISSEAGVLPISAQNQFLEQRMQLATNLSEFLKFAPRRPVTFYEEGRFGKLSDFLESRKSQANDGSADTQPEYESEIEESFRDLLPWEVRSGLEEMTVEIFNWHFPLVTLAEAVRNSALPNYLRRRLALATWTRAIVLKNDDAAQSVARDIITLAPELASTFLPYLQALSKSERQNAALFILLKHPDLSPLVAGGLPVSYSSDDYYFESAWWCPQSDTDYNNDGEAIAKVIAKPAFLSADQLAVAARERTALHAIGDAKSYLGRQVLAWARLAPRDERIPEALFIAVQANRQYKYGCDGWEYDVKTKQAAESLLRDKYPRSAWTAKLLDSSN